MECGVVVDAGREVEDGVDEIWIGGGSWLGRVSCRTEGLVSVRARSVLAHMFIYTCGSLHSR